MTYARTPRRRPPTSRRWRRRSACAGRAMGPADPAVAEQSGISCRGASEAFHRGRNHTGPEDAGQHRSPYLLTNHPGMANNRSSTTSGCATRSAYCRTGTPRAMPSHSGAYTPPAAERVGARRHVWTGCMDDPCRAYPRPYCLRTGCRRLQLRPHAGGPLGSSL